MTNYPDSPREKNSASMIAGRFTVVNERNSRVADAMRAAGIQAPIRILDADAKTAVAAAQQLGCAVGAIANSLVFDCDGGPLLVMASGARRVDTELLARVLGAATIGKASPSMVKEATGQVIGGVAPVGHPTRLRTVIDESLSAHPVIWTAAGTADAVMPMNCAQLVAVTEGVAVQVR